MVDLVDFLRQRLDEDEQAARKAAEVCGCHPPAPSWSFDDESTDGRILIADDPHPDVRHKLNRRWSGTYQGLFAAQHIARHDPARVLREVEAKRRIIADLMAEPHEVCDDQYYTCSAATYERDGGEPEDRRRGGECNCGRDERVERRLRLLALPYADHPDYREEWRP